MQSDGLPTMQSSTGMSAWTLTAGHMPPPFLPIGECPLRRYVGLVGPMGMGGLPALCSTWRKGSSEKGLQREWGGTWRRKGHGHLGTGRTQMKAQVRLTARGQGQNYPFLWTPSTSEVIQNLIPHQKILLEKQLVVKPRSSRRIPRRPPLYNNHNNYTRLRPWLRYGNNI